MKYMLFGTQQKVGIMPSTSVTYKDDIIEKVYEFRYSGIKLDLTYLSQTMSIILKVKQ